VGGVVAQPLRQLLQLRLQGRDIAVSPFRAQLQVSCSCWFACPKSAVAC
jgi:hypothetical protein